jgi:hypothetical protein
MPPHASCRHTKVSMVQIFHQHLYNTGSVNVAPFRAQMQQLTQYPFGEPQDQRLRGSCYLESLLVSRNSDRFEARSQNCEKRLYASSCLPVCPSVRPSARMEQLGSHWMDFHKIFRQSLEKIQVSLKSDKNNRRFTWRPIHIFLSYLAQFFLGSKMFQTEVVEKIKTRVLCSITFFFNRAVYDNVVKYCTTGQTTDDNLAHAHCVLDT